MRLADNVIMIKQLLVLPVILSIMGCAYNGPIKREKIENQRLVNAPVEQVWSNAIRTLASEGYPILTASKEAGVISTGKKLTKLTEADADCGNIWGLPYVKDDRTTTNVSQSVILVSAGSSTAVTVNTQIEGLFNAQAGGDGKRLDCFSQGSLEKSLLQKF
jgi:hypothetical protein